MNLLYYSIAGLDLYGISGTLEVKCEPHVKYGYKSCYCNVTRICECVKCAWASTLLLLVEKSFIKRGIMNSLDGTEDDAYGKMAMITMTLLLVMMNMMINKDKRACIY